MRETTERGQFKSVQQLSRELHIKSMDIYGMIHHGEIRAVKFNNKIAIPQEEVAKLMGKGA